MNMIEYADREMMFIGLANILAGELKNCLLHHDFASFSVPGGTTPGPIFDALCAADLDWSRVHVFLNDERWVPEDHERSNTRLIKERLLTDRAADATYVPLYRDAPTPEDAMNALSATFASELPVSLLLLGMGTDGHTASIFPGADRLRDALDPSAPPVMAMRAPGAPEPRITLTMPVLKGAMSQHIVITGDKKKQVIEQARHQSGEQAPISELLSTATVHWAE
ncbi:MAG: 6-phosphogluconolactonase [Rhodobacteraceae bacterium]|nr:6-phosphogluconolactonase [Paracoccaceae bacterium]